MDRKKAVVYVKNQSAAGNLFEYREITLGAEANDYYIVEDGIKEGEEVATNGVFKIDAAAQLSGKASMMNPEGGKTSTGHDHGNMDMEPSQLEDEMGNKMENPAQNDKFKEQLTEVFLSYIDLKNHLVASSPSEAQSEADHILNTLNKVDMSLLNSEQHKKWMPWLNQMKKDISGISGTDNLQEQRDYFRTLSNILYESMKYFNVTDLEVYYQFCPMANNNKGAYWLSMTEEINNPYFGSAMLKCGETREEL